MYCVYLYCGICIVLLCIVYLCGGVDCVVHRGVGNAESAPKGRGNSSPADHIVAVLSFSFLFYKRKMGGVGVGGVFEVCRYEWHTFMG